MDVDGNLELISSNCRRKFLKNSPNRFFYSLPEKVLQDWPELGRQFLIFLQQIPVLLAALVHCFTHCQSGHVGLSVPGMRSFGRVRT